MISYQLQHLRKRKGWNQKQLAQELHISASTIGMYEQGRRVPSLDIIVSMAQIFDVSLDYLITGAEYPKSSTSMPDNCPCKTCYWNERIRK